MGNRKDTEKRILDAVDRIVDELGFEGLGINAVAREAGVSKVLIYRYFGGFEPLLRAWARRTHFWTSFELADVDDGCSVDVLKQFAKDVFCAQIDALMSNPLLRKLIRWHLSSASPVSYDIMREVEERGTVLSASFLRRIDVNYDAEAVVSLLIAGITYICALSDFVDVFNAVPLVGDSAVDRLKGAACDFVELMFLDAS